MTDPLVAGSWGGENQLPEDQYSCLDPVVAAIAIVDAGMQGTGRLGRPWTAVVCRHPTLVCMIVKSALRLRMAGV